MIPKAILFGAIGVVTETSDIQRRAFNAAFEDAGLDWNWSEEDYLEMLTRPGGARRVADYADRMGVSVDAGAVHDGKVGHFQRLVAEHGIAPRPGVVETIAWARKNGVKLGFATATSPETVALILDGLAPAINRSDFDFIGDGTKAERGKPAPDIYNAALAALGVAAEDAVAVEDTPESAEAAVAAGIRTLGHPGVAARHRRFSGEVRVIETLRPEELTRDA